MIDEKNQADDQQQDAQQQATEDKIRRLEMKVKALTEALAKLQQWQAGAQRCLSQINAYGHYW